MNNCKIVALSVLDGVIFCFKEVKRMKLTLASMLLIFTLIFFGCDSITGDDGLEIKVYTGVLALNMYGEYEGLGIWGIEVKEDLSKNLVSVSLSPTNEFWLNADYFYIDNGIAILDQTYKIWDTPYKIESGWYYRVVVTK